MREHEHFTGEHPEHRGHHKHRDHMEPLELGKLQGRPEHPGRQITKIAREVNRLLVSSFRAEAVGSGEIDMIHLIRHNPGISQKDVCEALNMDKGAVARRTANLEEKGYLTRKTNPDDQRAQLLYPTEKAGDLRDSKESVESVFYAWLIDSLDEEERTAFLRTLEKLYRRSHAESRAGFPEVRALLAAAQDTSDRNTLTGDADTPK